MWWLLSYKLYIGRYGCTKITISDQGREFVNRVSESLFAQTRTEHRISTAYHPQTNGLVERYNQTLQRSLLKLVNKQQNNWDEFIGGVLFAYRTSKQKSTQFTPFELMYCRCVAHLFLFATLLYMPHCPSLGSEQETSSSNWARDAWLWVSQWCGWRSWCQSVWGRNAQVQEDTLLQSEHEHKECPGSSKERLRQKTPSPNG